MTSLEALVHEWVDYLRVERGASAHTVSNYRRDALRYVRDLAYRAIANPAFSLSAENLRSAFENVVPLSATAPEKIAAIRDWGRERAVPASGRPIGSETELKKSAEMRTRKVLV